MLDLEPRYVAIVKKILAAHIPAKVVWVYGSRVKGTAHAGSDLDLVVIDSDANLSPEILSALRAAFSESDLPISVDILNWTNIPDVFKDEIEKMHEILQ
jgi:predicted nucleotidyltransferase